MHDDQLRFFRRYTRVFPATAYGRHTPRVGCSVATDARPNAGTSVPSSASRTSCVKILALLCSKAPSHGTSPDKTCGKSSTLPTPAQPRAVPHKRTHEESAGNGDAPASAQTSSTSPEPPCGGNVKRLRSDPDGSSEPSEPMDSPMTTASSAAVKQEAEARTTIADASEGKTAAAAAASCDTAEPTPTASLYVRVQYDKTLITTLPIEVMRMQHPQVLIDYLLSMSVWA
ncbi:hypothetical protein, conserved [Leishmania tarentolae]|uniref:Uncharacterized protein n=1 Tax=Leishmania tarentolae TaxID=5689 RepID=A0A640KRM4_LEITA|nr:hypothetical protein, conserved [Leishmania tarentolae]